MALIGQTFGNYRLENFLGGGAFSFVFEGVHQVSGESVAVKVLQPNARDEDIDEFKTEAALLGALVRSSNVVTFVSAETASPAISFGGIELSLDIRYMVLEMASACLDELLADRLSVTWTEKMNLWRGLILGVHQMHLKRLVHRDLKASNCLLFVEAKKKTVAKIADLGRGKHLDTMPRFEDEVYSTGRGDLRFAAPEFLWLQGQRHDSAHLAADLYGLGSVLFEIATGVGLTHMALGPGPALVRANAFAHMNGEATDLSVLVSKYGLALDIFADEVPAIIRHESRALLALLCDPRPEMRRPVRIGRVRAEQDGLAWLLRRADILVARLGADQKRAVLSGRNRSNS